jgi:hypothetical protein
MTQYRRESNDCCASPFSTKNRHHGHCQALGIRHIGVVNEEYAVSTDGMGCLYS